MFAGSANNHHRNRTWQLFGRIGTLSPNPFEHEIQSSTLEVTQGLLSETPECTESRLWLISGYTRQTIRDNQDPAVGPLTQAEIVARSTPGASFSNRGLVQWRVRLMKTMGEVTFFVDAAQEIEVWANQVLVNPWVPPGTQLIEGPGTPTPLDGTVFDALTQGGIEPIQSAKGMHLPKLTTRHVLPGGTNEELRIEIPPYAKYVQVYSSNRYGAEAADPVFFWAWGGDPELVPVARVVVPFVEAPAATFSNCVTDRLLVPDADHLVIYDNDLEPDDNIVCVWELAV